MKIVVKTVALLLAGFLAGNASAESRMSVQEIPASEHSQVRYGIESWLVSSSTNTTQVEMEVTALPKDKSLAPTTFAASLARGKGLEYSLARRGASSAWQEQFRADGTVQVTANYHGSRAVRNVAAFELNSVLENKTAAASLQEISGIAKIIGEVPELSKAQLPETLLSTRAFIDEREQQSKSPGEKASTLGCVFTPQTMTEVSMIIASSNTSLACVGACATTGGCFYTGIFNAANPTCWGAASICAMCGAGGLAQQMNDCAVLFQDWREMF